MKKYTRQFGLLLIMVTLFVIVGFSKTDHSGFIRYYYQDGTFYLYTASTVEEYFQSTPNPNKGAFRDVDWRKLNSFVLQKMKEKNQSAEKPKDEETQADKRPTPPSSSRNKQTEDPPKQKQDTRVVNQLEFEQEVIRLTNIEREKHGLHPLKMDKKLGEVARKKSVDMMENNYFSHESPTYGSPFDMMVTFGVTYYSAGENIARGQTTPKEVVQAWMDSEGHKENILYPDYTHIGVGFVQDGNYWTQEFVKQVDDTVSQTAYEQKVVELTNQEREKYGLAPLKFDEKLAEVARKKSQDMADQDYFDHTSPTYGSPFDMMEQFAISYQTAGENIARGQFTPEEVVQAWMDSEGHRANILNPNYTDIGVGFVKDGIIWTQEFIGK